MLRVRDDDVGLTSEGVEYDRLKSTHELLNSIEGVIHVPTIIASGLTDDNLVSYLKEKFYAQEIIPELHGWEHIDYGKLSREEISEHLKKSVDMMTSKLYCHPSTFYTPWGANTPAIQEAAADLALHVVDCSNVHQVKKMKPALTSRHYEEYCKSYKDHGEVMIHFWEGFCWKTPEKLKRYLECIVKEERLVV